MLCPKDRIFLNLPDRFSVSLKEAQKGGDWDQTSTLIQKGSEWIIKEIQQSGLRGRGGGGFPTGKKWDFMPKEADPNRPHYLVINGDESEPGTCKDREILCYEPHKIIEGALLAAFAIQAHVGYIYLRGEYKKEYSYLEKAIQEAYNENLLGKNAAGSGWDFDLYIHRGAGAYICGEESALLESLEGKKGFPRLKPPFPAQAGLYGCPTTINNIETIAVVSTILRRGASWFASIGRPNNTGTKIFSLSGHVNNPCVVEEALGIPLKELVEKYGGGVIGGWDSLKAVIPGGISCPLIPKAICDSVLMDFDRLKMVHSALGTGGIIVMNQSTDLLKVLSNISAFYMHESCGQCSPCREGTGWLWRAVEAFSRGEGSVDDIDQLNRVTKQIEGHTICGLGDAAAWPIQGAIRYFRAEIEERLK